MNSTGNERAAYASTIQGAGDDHSKTTAAPARFDIRTIALTLFLLAGIFIGAEFLMRTRFVQENLAYPSLGTRHWQLSAQWDRLESAAADVGPLDCIFLGNSMVWRGVDVEAFTSAYKQATSQDITCFNFGVDGLPAAGAGALAQVVVADYRPKLLIYGTDPRDYAVSRHSEDASVILDTPWLQYRLGNFTLEGWLYEHSYLRRYWDRLQQLRRYDLESALSQAETAVMGFQGDPSVGEFVLDPPDSDSNSRHIQYYFELLADYRLLPENLDGLAQIAALNSPDLKVILLEMPVPATYMLFFGEGTADYERYTAQLVSLAEVYAVPLIFTTTHDLIPVDGWVDYSHLNYAGAAVLSDWLGKQIAQHWVAEG